MPTSITKCMINPTPIYLLTSTSMSTPRPTYLSMSMSMPTSTPTYMSTHSKLKVLWTRK